jgi:RHS repeat-associated protein
MELPGRHFAAATSYRYGFNGKEKDDEINPEGDGDGYDYGARIYDPRLGKFMSVDAVAGAAPHMTPYRFGFDSPISYFDADGNYEAVGKTTAKQDQAISKEASKEAKAHKGKYGDLVKSLTAAKVQENIAKIDEYVKNAKDLLDNNSTANEAFEKLTDSEHNKKNRTTNFFTNNGKGPKISLEDLDVSANTDKSGSELRLGLSTGYGARTLLHEFIHYASFNNFIKGDATEGGYSNLTIGGNLIGVTSQLDAIVQGYNSFHTANNQVTDLNKFKGKYSDSIKQDSKSKVISGSKVEGGYLFEVLGFGNVMYQKK